jgi:hypothetical protein
MKSCIFYGNFKVFFLRKCTLSLEIVKAIQKKITGIEDLTVIRDFISTNIEFFEFE